jgi:hypothetical protein
MVYMGWDIFKYSISTIKIKIIFAIVVFAVAYLGILLGGDEIYNNTS